MKHEIAVLWQLHDMTRHVVDALLEGLKKTAEAHPNKFSLEAKRSIADMATQLHKNFNLLHLVGIGLLPLEYQKVAHGLTEAAGLKDRIVRYRPDDALRWLLHFYTDLQALSNGMQ